ncbi:hypothetical protein AMYX_09150 [Anaeromyxobacter diazotrophicus]|uniref:Uncharacterized protein n=1 Tax=Anaeromyxobacter diazotrophicus TaxID=2590199 RepID=A0A7I9VIE4_9BACT|nr:hypothetical protein AMYX_09150 [Anaeromyxobacter diazotrophicus]
MDQHAVHEPRGEERRVELGAALDQEVGEAEGPEPRQQVVEIHPAAAAGAMQHGHPRPVPALPAAGEGGDQGRRLGGDREHPQRGRQAEPGVEHHPHRIVTASSRQPRVEDGIVLPGGAGAHQHRVDLVAQPVHLAPRRLSRHPARVAAGGGDLAVERDGGLEGDERPAGLDEAQPRRDERVAGGARHVLHDLDPGAPQPAHPSPLHERVRVARADEHAPDARREQGAAAGRRLAEVIARLERGVEIGAPGGGARGAQRHHLGVRAAGPGVVPARHHPAGLDQHRAHRRVGVRPAEALRRLAQREAHEPLRRVAHVDPRPGPLASPSSSLMNSPTSVKAR